MPGSFTLLSMETKKTCQIGVRVEPEYFARVKKAAAEMQSSLSELILQNTNMFLVIHYRGMIDRLREMPPAGLSEENMRTWLADLQENHDYFSAELEKVKAKAQMYEEIENLETYRDFLRDTVTA